MPLGSDTYVLVIFRVCFVTANCSTLLVQEGIGTNRLGGISSKVVQTMMMMIMMIIIVIAVIKGGRGGAGG